MFFLKAEPKRWHLFSKCLGKVSKQRENGGNSLDRRESGGIERRRESALPHPPLLFKRFLLKIRMIIPNDCVKKCIFFRKGKPLGGKPSKLEI